MPENEMSLDGYLQQSFFRSGFILFYSDVHILLYGFFYPKMIFIAYFCVANDLIYGA